MTRANNTDVCLSLEGTYPYVPGGVSGWTHELITRQDHLRFHIVSLMPKGEIPRMRYTLPSNVTGLTTLRLQELPSGLAPKPGMLEPLRAPLTALTTDIARLGDLNQIFDTVREHRQALGSFALLDSEEAWQLLTSMYEASFSESSFLDYFWSWRAILGGLYLLLLAELPQAKIYHSLSTGYAGLLAARAKLETGKPVLLTEHGIYTNERRVEIASADWLEETASRALTIDRTRRNLRDLWIDTFTNYSRICYEACDHIITLFAGNQRSQIEDGADLRKMRIIPNGIDIERFAAIEVRLHARPTVALIGRVVPIKDIKSFIRAAAMLHQTLPDLRALIMGPTDEDSSYFQECRTMVEYLALERTVFFTGPVKIDDYLAEIDVVAISSISEAQPLVILEAGACGIPVVATDVGACREMILSKPDERPALGAGGAIVPLSNPTALAEALLHLLTDQPAYARASRIMRQRIATYYNKRDQITAYRDLYASCMASS
jgi:polysaccharide biosynthesis protein PelF